MSLCGKSSDPHQKKLPRRRLWTWWEYYDGGRKYGTTQHSTTSLRAYERALGKACVYGRPSDNCRSSLQSMHSLQGSLPLTTEHKLLRYFTSRRRSFATSREVPIGKQFIHVTWLDHSRTPLLHARLPIPTRDTIQFDVGPTIDTEVVATLLSLQHASQSKNYESRFPNSA